MKSSMIKYPDYVKATNAAYELLLSLKINRLPIDINSVIKKLPDVRLKTYGEICTQTNMQFNEFITEVGSEYGYLNRRYKKGVCQYIILYNEIKSLETKRFTIVHELGHIILNHVKDDRISAQEANSFTRNFLCPIPIAIEKRLFTCTDYVNTYNISPIAAEVSVAFRRTDFNNITMDNYFNICRLFDTDRKFKYVSELDRIMGYRVPVINV